MAMVYRAQRKILMNHRRKVILTAAKNDYFRNLYDIALVPFRKGKLHSAALKKDASKNLCAHPK